MCLSQRTRACQEMGKTGQAERWKDASTSFALCDYLLSPDCQKNRRLSGNTGNSQSAAGIEKNRISGGSAYSDSVDMRHQRGGGVERDSVLMDLRMENASNELAGA